MRLAQVVTCCLLLASAAGVGDDALWLRYPAISPDGRTIAFTYKGDIYSVAADGGVASPVTISESYDVAPVWSHDGRSLAFASDRYGNFDVFVMPATGGEAKRLTFHSSDETPGTFTSDDNSVLFSGYRQDVVTNVQFPISMMDELYRVPVDGGRVAQVLPVPALNATLSSNGDKLIYHDIKGYESEWRKHHTSAVTRDIWVHDFKTGSSRSSPGSPVRTATRFSAATTTRFTTSASRTVRSTSIGALCPILREARRSRTSPGIRCAS